MPNIIEEIPTSLEPAANAALAWINSEHSASYKLTGLVDPDLNWQPEQGAATELGLVLCENDMCAREQVRIQQHGNEFQITSVPTEDALIPPRLDPPIGVRSSWLDERLKRSDFTVFLFYRGLW